MRRIPVKLCELALEEFSSLPIAGAQLTHDGSQYDEEVRRALVRSPAATHWLASIMFDVAKHVNDAYWQFDIEGHEGLAHLTYIPTCHYDWHIDVHFNPDREYDRKMTVICLLNSEQEFSGGEFMYRDLETNKEEIVDFTQGQVLAFPSFMPHKVAPVVEGVRHAAVLWVYGPRFR